MTQPTPLDLTTGAGRAPALGPIPYQRSAAQAECLRDIRESQSYKSTGLTWEEFCTRSFGLSRRRADEIIQRLEEFGAAYFQLSELVRISPETYRQLAPHIQGDKIELGGQTIDLIPQNAALLRHVVAGLRTAAAPPARSSQPATAGSRLAALEKRFDAWIGDLAALKRESVSGGFEPAVARLMDAATSRLTGLRAKAAR